MTTLSPDLRRRSLFRDHPMVESLARSFHRMQNHKGGIDQLCWSTALGIAEEFSATASDLIDEAKAKSGGVDAVAEYRQSLQINVDIIDRLRDAFRPLSDEFDRATSDQMHEAERRMHVLNGDTE